jgi:hypothetical protein
MKAYKIWLIFLKLLMLVQFILISLGYLGDDHISYLITDLLFKTSLGTFLFVYFYLAGSPKIDGWDELFISFGGGLLIFDAWYNTFPKILRIYGYYFNPYTFYFSDKPEKKEEQE